MSKAGDRFSFFHEAQAPAGAEGWQRMYPYFLVSQPEGRAVEDSRFWFADSMHWSRAVHPFDSIGAEAVYYGAGTYAIKACDRFQMRNTSARSRIATVGQPN